MEPYEIQQRLESLQEELESVRGRMPAHSAKPAIMAELIALEDERDELLRMLERINT